MPARFSIIVLFGSLASACAVPAHAQWYDNYQNLTSIYDRLDQFQTTYPGLVSSFSIGQSYEGREIRGIRISGTGGAKSTKPAVLLNSMQHAREWITPMTTIYAAEQLLAEYSTSSSVMEMLDEVDFYVIPVVNPDGYEYSWASPANRYWRKNRRDNGNGTFGVDLNRNWGFGWGGGGSSLNPLSDTYRGTAPFSEPETAAMRDFYYNHPNLVGNIDFHSFTQLILGPFGFSFVEEPADNALMMDLAVEMAASIKAVHGKTYVPQPASDLYQASGISIDWTYGSENVYSYTIELRPAGPLNISSFDLPPEEILPTAEEAYAAVLDLGEFTAALAHGDFNYDQTYDIADLNALADGIVNGTSKAEYDVNGDSLINVDDVETWLQNAGESNLPGGKPYLPGDANLDGIVNQIDYDMWFANRFASPAAWDLGDFNVDGTVDGQDLSIWLANAVPEPTSLALAMLAVAGLSTTRRIART
ncbi:MAG: PEP-CTERM sorting domain-containing protein [Pirellulales bacterium]|nr:PEP-CTERM sorting domain-containing protein [Pirellulales bacterium]